MNGEPQLIAEAIAAAMHNQGLFSRVNNYQRKS